MSVYDVFAAFVICSRVVAGAADWEYYGDRGPSTWKDIEGSYCGNSSQSPINIVTEETENKCLGEFVFNGYSLTDAYAGTPLNISNNGHTLVVSLSDNYTISGGGLPAIYKAAQFHFHWGNQSGQGSEHTLDGTPYDAEMHIVHYNEKYDNASAAVSDEDQDRDGLAVLGVFLNIGSEDNEAFAKVFDMTKRVEFEDQEESIDENARFSVADLLPNDLTTFYRYNGSLTTPGCNEIVVWTVFKEAVSISQAQIDKLRSLYEGRNDTSELIQNNYRPVQALNDRVVTVNNCSATDPMPSATAPTSTTIAPTSSATALTYALVALSFAVAVHVFGLSMRCEAV